MSPADRAGLIFYSVLHPLTASFDISDWRGGGLWVTGWGVGDCRNVLLYI